MSYYNGNCFKRSWGWTTTAVWQLHPTWSCGMILTRFYRTKYALKQCRGCRKGIYPFIPSHFVFIGQSCPTRKSTLPHFKLNTEPWTVVWKPDTLLCNNHFSSPKVARRIRRFRYMTINIAYWSWQQLRGS